MKPAAGHGGPSKGFPRYARFTLPDANRHRGFIRPWDIWRAHFQWVSVMTFDILLGLALSAGLLLYLLAALLAPERF